MFPSNRQKFHRSGVGTVETSAEKTKIFRMPRRTCRRPRPTEPPPLKYRDENEAVTSVILSTRSTRIETPTALGKVRPSGDHALQQLGQSAQGDKTKDESTPTDIARSRSSSLGAEVWRAHGERAKNDLKLSVVVRGKDVHTIWWGSVQVDFLGHTTHLTHRKS